MKTFNQGFFMSKSEDLKNCMNSLSELIESWICNLFHEEERLKKLHELAEIIKENQGVFTKTIREDCLERIDFLIGAGNTSSYASSTFRLRLQDLLRSAVANLTKVISELSDFAARMQLDNPDESSSGLILAQENERKRISREIHDGPAQLLANLTMRIDFCLEKINSPEILKEELVELKASIIRSLKELRRYIFDLRPMALDDLGLIPTLEQFISGFNSRTGITVNLHREGEAFRVSQEKELAVFRVIQEAVSNSSRHSEGKSIRVFIVFDPSAMAIKCSVEDDGAGFDVETIRKNYATMKKMGLLSMEERIRLAGGDFSIISSPGNGCKVSFAIYS
ncbi:MAG: sensor histidine kinase [Candidatus Riflebacteria bacterium]|nr:sensor histidine kinase [Candidatus Riflebacteria bacterium]